MSTTIKTLERRPRTPSNGPAPLLVLLHGYGADERDLFDLADYLDPRLHVVSARAPLALPWGGFAWYHLGGTPGNLVPDPTSRARALELLEQFVATLPTRLGTDPQRTLLLGFSQGSILSLALAMRRPDLMVGVMALSGYLDLALLPEPRLALNGLPIIQMHGTSDEVIPVTAAHQTRDFLQTTDANHQYHEYPIGHGIHPQGLTLIQTWVGERLG
ncbi:MAG: alpha/beta hydrolase [Oscillochloridaceae bacterium umkhey_bin13]